MIGKCQGKAEISLNTTEVAPQARLGSDCVYELPSIFFLRPTHEQRGQTSICGNNAGSLSPKIELG